MNVNALGLPVIDDAVIAFVFFLAVCFLLLWRFWDRVDYDDWMGNYDDELEFDEREEHDVNDEYNDYDARRIWRFWEMDYDEEQRERDERDERDER